MCSKLSSHEQESPHSLVPESCVDRKRVNHTQLATKKHGIGKKFRVQQLLDSQVPESCVERKRVNHAQLTTKITLDQYTV